MKLPKTISIAGRRIRLVRVQMDVDFCYGEYHHDRKRIHIAREMSVCATLTTIRHEMMEAALLLSGVGWLEAYEQEAVVRCMEEIFFPAWGLFIKRLNKLNTTQYNGTNCTEI